MRIAISLFIIIISLSCKKSAQKELDKDYWQDVYMKLGSQQELMIYNFQDSIVFRKWTDSLIRNEPNKKEWIKTNETVEMMKITTSEKDSLFKWTKNLLKPVKPVHNCTDYVGHLLIRINHGTISSRIVQTCEYSSICKWSIVNNDTESIFNFLKKKVKSIE